MFKTGTGTAMRLIRPRVVIFQPAQGRGPKLNDRIVEVRKLLRTDMPLKEIAKQLGVSAQALTRFIRQRNICDLKERDSLVSKIRMAAGGR